MRVIAEWVLTERPTDPLPTESGQLAPSDEE
jgi:hypothetical protein